jgi:glycosyltransferase involved in cell wall biosynthesis
MKIVQVASYYPPYYGGIESHVYYLSQGLVDLGHEVTVLTSRVPKDGPVEEVRDGVLVKRFWTPLLLFNYPFIPALSFRVLSEEADIFHGHINSPMVVEQAAVGSWLRRAPFVATYHADIVPEDIGLKNKVLGETISWVYESFFKKFDVSVADRIIATTPLYAESSAFLAEYLDKVSIIPNGVDLDRFKPDLDVSEFKVRLGLEDRKIILFAGRFVHYKGLFCLLEAFSALRKVRTDVKLVLLGIGPLMDAVRGQVHLMKLVNEIVFVGSVSEEDLVRFYVASDIVVVPSRSRSEGFSISALQGMACGKPVIATRVGGVPFLVRNGETGIIVEPRSWEELASAMLSLLEDAVLADKMGRAGRRRAERFFGWSKVAKMTEELYEAVL